MGLRRRVGLLRRRRAKRADRANSIICVAKSGISIRRIGGPRNGIGVPQVGRGYAPGKISLVRAVSVGVSIRIHHEVGIDPLTRGRGDRCNWRRWGARHGDLPFHRRLRGDRRHSRGWRNRSGRRGCGRRDLRSNRCRCGSWRIPRQQIVNNCENAGDQNKVFCIHGT